MREMGWSTVRNRNDGEDARSRRMEGTGLVETDTKRREQSKRRRNGKLSRPLLEAGKGLLVERLDLLKVDRLLSGRWRTAGVSSGVDGSLVGVVLGGLEGSEESRLDVAPSTSVERLLLGPDDVGVGELVDVRGEEVVGEGRDLLDSADDDVVELSVLTFLDEGLVDLTYEGEIEKRGKYVSKKMQGRSEDRVRFLALEGWGKETNRSR
jgi:hypothetical protein